MYIEQTYKQSVIREGAVYRVNYIINGRLYSIRVKPVRGPAVSMLTPEERGRISCLNHHEEVHS